jgi:hypothetical protein
MAVIAACAGLLGACSGSGGDSNPMDPMGKFASLPELLANPDVQIAISNLPAGTGVAAGDYYKGNTPADVSGTWSSMCCGGATGRWNTGDGFGGKFTFDVTGPGHIDTPAITSSIESETGGGSFITGTGNEVTLFLQLLDTCAADQEHVRMVSVDRFIFAADATLSQYSRSYVVLARDKLTGPWSCAGQPVGSGAYTTTPGTLGWDPSGA